MGSFLFKVYILIKYVQEKLTKRLDQRLIPARRILSNFRFLDERLRETTRYQDPQYIPFYYYLGNETKPRKLAEFGCDIALHSSACLLGSQGVCKVLLVDRGEYYSARLAKANIKQLGFSPHVYIGNQIPEIYNQDQWDLVLINNEYYLQYLNLIWEKVTLDGLICCMDFKIDINEKIKDFCKVKNRESMVILARYNMYIIKK